MTEVKENSKQYQWRKGDNFGEVVDVLNADEKFINFTNGERIFRTLVSEFLEPVVDGVLPFPSPVGVAPKTNKKPVTETKAVEAAPVSIMGKMITKMSKKNVVSVPITINLNIPTPELYSILAGGMEDEDLNEEIAAAASSQIEIEKLHVYVKENITTFLEQYYQ